MSFEGHTCFRHSNFCAVYPSGQNSPKKQSVGVYFLALLPTGTRQKYFNVLKTSS